MSTTPIRYCTNGHDMLEPGRLYITPKGRWVCRTCRGVKLRPEGTRKYTKPSPAQAWAQKAWDAMNDRDRWIVRQALATVDLTERT